MKRILCLLAVTVITCSVMAQEKMDKKMDKMDKKMDKMDKMDHGMKDCIMMKDGKMMVMKSGKTMGMDKDMTMKNGTMIMTDGTVKMKDGTTKMMKEGDMVDMSGKMGAMKMHDKMMNH